MRRIKPKMQYVLSIVDCELRLHVWRRVYARWIKFSCFIAKWLNWFEQMDSTSSIATYNSPNEREKCVAQRECNNMFRKSNTVRFRFDAHSMTHLNYQSINQSVWRTLNSLTRKTINSSFLRKIILFFGAAVYVLTSVMRVWIEKYPVFRCRRCPVEENRKWLQDVCHLHLHFIYWICSLLCTSCVDSQSWLLMLDE